MTWDDFLYKMAGDMGIKKDSISLAYRFSTTPKSDLPRALTKPTHFSALWEDARKEVETLEIKKSSKRTRSVKPFKILLIDRSLNSKQPRDGTKSVSLVVTMHRKY